MYTQPDNYKIIQLVPPTRPLFAHVEKKGDEIFRMVEFCALCSDGEIRTISLCDNGTGFFINESEELNINGDFLHGDLEGVYPAEYVTEYKAEQERFANE